MNAILKFIYKHSNYKISNKIVEREYKKERAIKGYCKQDLWGIDEWFTGIIPIMLQEFRNDLHGCPFGMSLEEWETILDKMICLSKEMQKFYDSGRENTDAAIKAKDEFFKMFSEHFYDLWD